MSESLILWDIDGTLVSMDRAGERALLVAIRELYQRDLAAAPTRPSLVTCWRSSA
jgi:phosphoglycolate phosphatase-like HAD superfamily hydrolase